MQSDMFRVKAIACQLFVDWFCSWSKVAKLFFFANNDSNIFFVWNWFKLVCDGSANIAWLSLVVNHFKTTKNCFSHCKNRAPFCSIFVVGHLFSFFLWFQIVTRFTIGVDVETDSHFEIKLKKVQGVFANDSLDWNISRLEKKRWKVFFLNNL